MAKFDVDKTIQDIVYLKNQIDGLGMLLTQKKSNMAKYFEKTGEKNISTDECVLFVQERPEIKYDIEAIREALDPDLASRFVDTTHTVRDWRAFISLCKKHGIPPSTLKPYISVVRSVNQTKLSKLYEKGVVSLSDLEGCYTAEIKKSVAIRMKNADREIPIAQADS